ncbi:MAG: RNA polymerase sigma factor [Pseudobdellovibrionaceae bacterium]
MNAPRIVSDEDDETLALQAKGGSARAFEALIERHYMTIYRFAYRYAGNQRDAEDVTQEVCVKLAGALGTFKGNSKFTSWLYTVTTRTAIDWSRAQGRHDRRAVAIDPELTGEGANAERALHSKQILERLQDLKEDERTALLLVFVEELSHKEAAQVMGTAESTVSWKIHEARKALKAAGLLTEGGV